MNANSYFSCRKPHGQRDKSVLTWRPGTDLSPNVVVSGLPVHDKTADLESHLLRVEKNSWCTSRNTIDAELIFFKASRLMPRFY